MNSNARNWRVLVGGVAAGSAALFGFAGTVASAEPDAPEPAPAPANRPARPAETPPSARKAEGLSFTEKKRLAELPDLIARLEAEIGKLAQLLETPDLFTKEPVKFRKASEMLADRQAALSAAEEEWLDLETRAGG